MSDDRSKAITVADLAIAWAADYFQFQDKLQLSSKPWGITYRLRNSQADAFLKILPAPRQSAARTTPLLGKRFPGRVPAAIASDEDRGFLLLKNHQATAISTNPSRTERQLIVRTYAGIQAEAAMDRAVLEQFPRLSVDDVVIRFLEFLRPDTLRTGTERGVVSAAHFLGNEEAHRFHELFEKRGDLLIPHLATSRRLRNTVNHLDLRASNAAIHSNGDCILYDWDASMVGPAGMSLHSILRGCLTPIALLARQRDYYKPDENRAAIKLVTEYVDELVKRGYATVEDLRAGLGGSITAGLMHYVTSFSYYSTASSNDQNAIATNILMSLSELLDICDFLAVQSKDPRILEFAKEYSSRDRGNRAHRLLKHSLERHPFDPALLEVQGRDFMKDGRFKNAIETFKNALQVAPENAAMHAELGYAYTANGDFDSAVYHLRRSIHLSPGNQQTRQLLESVAVLIQSREQANQQGSVPMVDLTDSERTSQVMSLGTLELCKELFLKYGILQLNNVFDQDVLTTCNEALSEKLDRYLKGEPCQDWVRIGGKRLQMTIDLQPPFDHGSIFASPLVLTVLGRLLSKYFILGAYSSSISLPGAEDQHVQRSSKNLFPDSGDHIKLPSFAISVMIPLINLDERTGTIRVRKGSHLLRTGKSEKLPGQSPHIAIGSCCLMDYRLSHYSQANQSDVARPILNIFYQRAWFKDLRNFRAQPSIRVVEERFNALSESQQELLEWTQHPPSK